MLNEVLDRYYSVAPKLLATTYIARTPRFAKKATADGDSTQGEKSAHDENSVNGGVKKEIDGVQSGGETKAVPADAGGVRTVGIFSVTATALDTKVPYTVDAFVYAEGEESVAGENSHDTLLLGTRARRQERVAGDFTADIALLTLLLRRAAAQVVVGGAGGAAVPVGNQAALRQLLFAALHVVTGRVRRSGVITSWQEATVLVVTGHRACREAVATLVDALDTASRIDSHPLGGTEAGGPRLPLLRDWLQPALVLMDILCRPFIVCPLNWVPATHLARAAGMVVAGGAGAAGAAGFPLDAAVLSLSTGAGAVGASGGSGAAAPNVYTWPPTPAEGRRLLGVAVRCYQAHLEENDAHDGAEVRVGPPGNAVSSSVGPHIQARQPSPRSLPTTAPTPSPPSRQAKAGGQKGLRRLPPRG